MTPPEHGPKWRLRARTALEEYFRRRSHPRIILGFIVTIAGMAGFLVSYSLLHHGFTEMWLRYPLAVAGGYISFLVQLRLWVEIERIRYDPKQVELPSEPPVESSSKSRRVKDSDGSWLDWLDVPDVFDFGEGCLIGCLIAAVIGALVGAGGLLFSFIMTGSEFLAEVFLDAFVISMLYRHLKTAAREHWLSTAVRRTWRSALMLAAALALLGFGLSLYAPDSHSIGKALKQIFYKAESK